MSMAVVAPRAHPRMPARTVAHGHPVSCHVLAEGRGFLGQAPWMAIMVSVLGFNLLGDGLRDVLDPRWRGRR